MSFRFTRKHSHCRVRSLLQGYACTSSAYYQRNSRAHDASTVAVTKGVAARRQSPDEARSNHGISISSFLCRYHKMRRHAAGPTPPSTQAHDIPRLAQGVCNCIYMKMHPYPKEMSARTGEAEGFNSPPHRADGRILNEAAASGSTIGTGFGPAARESKAGSSTAALGVCAAHWTKQLGNTAPLD